jgi:hypothetical protein
MQIAVLTFDRFNELDSFITSAIWKVEPAGLAPSGGKGGDVGS